MNKKTIGTHNYNSKLSLLVTTIACLISTSAAGEGRLSKHSKLGAPVVVEAELEESTEKYQFRLE
jgi:hypothetical protein